MEQPALRISSLVKEYDTGLRALDGVSFEVPPGAFYALLGPNGAGKTTLINILGGLTRPSAGNATVLGHDVIADAMAARRVLGIVPQEIIFDPFFSTRRYLKQQSSYYGIFNNDDWIDELLHNLGLSDQADTNTRKLSGGMKRRLMVGMALVHKPAVVVLDEPTAGVDVSQRRSLWEFIHRLNDDGTTVILTTHYLEEAQELCEHIVMLNHGKILANETTKKLLENSEFHTKAINFRLVNDAAIPADLPFTVAPSSNDDGSYNIQIEDYEQVEKVIAHLRSRSCTIASMEVTASDLEDVFVHLTEK